MEALALEGALKEPVRTMGLNMGVQRFHAVYTVQCNNLEWFEGLWYGYCC
jgi:hypothetical protein